jgi:transcriptional regulator with XRE-family HTH domain
VIDIQQPGFGKRLRAFRTAAGLSQRDVAAGVVNPSYISLLENGTRVPTLDVVVHLARALGVPVSDLVDGAEIPQPTVDDTPDQGSSLVRDLLARSSMSFGDYGTAQRQFAEAYAAAKRDGNLIAAVQYGFELQGVLRALGEYQARYDLLAELVAALVDDGALPVEIQLEARTQMASAARETGRLSEGLELAEHTVERLAETALANTAEHVRALGVLISIRCDSGELRELRELVRQMLEMAERLECPSVLGRAHWAAFMGYSLLDDQEAAHHHLLHAHHMLATPNTSMQDWMRFCRAAAGALLRIGADATELDRYLGPARACVELVDTPAERSSLTLLEAGYQLKFGDPAVALELVKSVIDDMYGADVATARLTAGRALVRLGRAGEAIDELRAAAMWNESLSAYRNAAAIWREIDELRS